jgi:YegS/Rv2252/BmrU family lipid kinase
VKRCAFIYNPAARNGQSQANLAKLKQGIKGWPKADFYRSETEGHISQLVANLLPSYDIFVACGGDGTVLEVASELIHTEKSLGIIPLGTGNDLCKTLNIPRDIDKALALIKRGNSTKIDVGKCNDFYFLNSLGFGFDGLANRYALQLDKLPGFFRYAVAALKAAFKQNTFSVDINAANKEYSKELIMVALANGRVEGGSFWIAPGASITDGKLNLVTIRPASKWLIPLLLPLFLFKKAKWLPQVQNITIANATLNFNDKQEIHADGEIIKTDAKTFSISLLPKELKVITKSMKSTE